MAGLYANIAGLSLEWAWGLGAKRTGRPQAAPGRPLIFAAEAPLGGGFLPFWAALGLRLRAQTRPVLPQEKWQERKVTAWVMRDIFQTLSLPRGKFEPSLVRHLAAPLEAGESLMLFIEGLRTPQGSLLPAVLDQVPEAEVIPVGLRRKTGFSLQSWELKFGAPMDLQFNEEREAFMARLTQEFGKLR